MQKSGITLLIVLVVLIAGGVTWYVMGNNDQNGNSSTDNTELTQQAAANRENVPEVVATVNGSEITRGQFFALGEQVAAQVAGNGGDISGTEVQNQISNQALNLLVNQELLMQAAQEAGVEVAGSIDEQYAQLIQTAGGEEAFENQLEQAGITEEQIRADLETQLLVQTHLEEELNLSEITVTDEEVTTLYEQVQSANSTSTPALEEVREQLVTQVRAQKEQQLIDQYLAQLREAADIQVNI